jgi:hypothetical protein
MAPLLPLADPPSGTLPMSHLARWPRRLLVANCWQVSRDNDSREFTVSISGPDCVPSGPAGASPVPHLAWSLCRFTVGQARPRVLPLPKEERRVQGVDPRPARSSAPPFRRDVKGVPATHRGVMWHESIEGSSRVTRAVSARHRQDLLGLESSSKAAGCTCRAALFLRNNLPELVRLHTEVGIRGRADSRGFTRRLVDGRGICWMAAALLQRAHCELR